MFALLAGRLQKTIRVDGEDAEIKNCRAGQKIVKSTKRGIKPLTKLPVYWQCSISLFE